MSYTTSKDSDGVWEVRYAGKVVFKALLEEVADDFAIAMAAARHERLKREEAIRGTVGA